jgi:hypothetical protein
LEQFNRKWQSCRKAVTQSYGSCKGSPGCRSGTYNFFLPDEAAVSCLFFYSGELLFKLTQA